MPAYQPARAQMLLAWGEQGCAGESLCLHAKQSVSAAH